MERVPEEAFVRICEFSGEPDERFASEIAPRMRALMALSWISKTLNALRTYWYDNACDIAFHH